MIKKAPRADRRRKEREGQKHANHRFSTRSMVAPVLALSAFLVFGLMKGGSFLARWFGRVTGLGRKIRQATKLAFSRVSSWRTQKRTVAKKSPHSPIRFLLGSKGSISANFPFPAISFPLKKPRKWSRQDLLRFALSCCLLIIEAAIISALAVVLWKIHDPLLLKPLNLYDEGVTLMGAKRFATGEIPYRDFFTIYGPLKFSILGLAFQQFGANLLTARLFFLGISLLAYFCFYLFLRRNTNIFFAGLFTACILPFGDLSLAPLFFILIAWWFAAQTKSPRKPLIPFIGGGLIGMLFLLRLDFGGFIGGTVFFLLSLWALFDKKVSLKEYIQIIGKMGTTFVLVVFPVFVLLSNEQALRDYFLQAIFFPLFGTYQELRHLPWADIISFTEAWNGFTVDLIKLSDRLVWFFWPLPFFFAAGFWLIKAIKREIDISAFATNCLMGAFTLAALLYASHRSDLGHIMFLNLISLLFLLHLFSLFKNRFLSLIYAPLLMILLLAPTLDLKQGIEAVSAAPKKNYSFYPFPFPATTDNDDLEQTLRYFRKITADKNVYVGISDTSRVFVNNVMLPFLLEQKTVTRYHELHTGIVTTAPVQAEMLDELKSADYVVLWDFFHCEPNMGCASTNVRLVDDYIAKHFTKVAEYGKYKIMQKNNRT